jgi:hypothetical protein
MFFFPQGDFITGACLGAFISTVFYPVNTTKTHMQVDNCCLGSGAGRIRYLFGLVEDPDLFGLVGSGSDFFLLENCIV